MKKIYFLATALIVAVLFSSCGKAYKVSVQVDKAEANGKTAYLYAILPDRQNDPLLLDSTLVADNKYSFEADNYEGVTLPVQAVTSVGKVGMMMTEAPVVSPVMFFLEKGDIKINITEKTLSLAGSPSNDKFNTFYETASKLQNQEQPNMEQAVQLQKDLGQVFVDVIKSNVDNNIGHTLIMSEMTAQLLSPEQTKEILPLITEDFKTKYTHASDIIEFMERKVKSLMEEIVDATLIKEDASTADLREVVKGNKYTLIDFWASWCRPCINEIPTMKTAYADYKAKGFEIVGISIDQDQEEWKKAVKEHDMTWLQFTDQEGATADEYGVSTIPHTLLVDSEGKVVARNLRGEQLSQKLAELLN